MLAFTSWLSGLACSTVYSKSDIWIIDDDEVEMAGKSLLLANNPWQHLQTVPTPDCVIAIAEGAEDYEEMVAYADKTTVKIEVILVSTQPLTDLNISNWQPDFNLKILQYADGNIVGNKIPIISVTSNIIP